LLDEVDAFAEAGGESRVGEVELLAGGSGDTDL